MNVAQVLQNIENSLVNLPRQIPGQDPAETKLNFWYQKKVKGLEIMKTRGIPTSIYLDQEKLWMVFVELF